LTEYKIARLTPDQAAPFGHLTFPSLGSRIERLPPAWFLIGASDGLGPLGLAIAHPAGTAGDFLLSSISVAPAHRRHGIGRALLRAVEAEVEDRKGRRLHARFVSTVKNAAFVGLTGALHWSQPRIAGIHIVGEAGTMAEALTGWWQANNRASRLTNYSFEPWQQPADVDLDALARLRGQRSYRPVLDFERFAAAIDPVCSLQVRRAGELVGWIVATSFQGARAARYGNRVARLYPSSYLDERLWQSGILTAGYWRALTRQCEAYGRDSIAEYFTDYPRHIAWSRRRAAPIVLSMEEIHEVGKLL